MGIAEKTEEVHLTKMLKTIRTELKGSGIMVIIAAGVSQLLL